MEKILNVAIVGYGMSAQVFHAPFISTLPAFNLYAFVERSKSLSKERYPEAIIYRNMESLLADDQVDMVVITTPNDTHFPYAMQALEKGKHVVLEKPFSITTQEGRTLVEASKKSTGILSVYQNRRYVSDFITINDILQKHLLGDVHEYECHFDRYRPEAKPNAWREEASPGSGILYDLGSHLIDQALFLFGVPKYITADIRMQRPHAKTDDYFDLRLDFGYTKAILCSSMLVRQMGPRYMVHGTKGSFIKSGDDPQEALLKNGTLPVGDDWGKEPADIKGLLHTEVDGKEILEYVESHPGNFGMYYTNLYNTIVHNKPLREKPEHGFNTIRIIELAMQSSAEKRTVACDGLMDAPYPNDLA